MNKLIIFISTLMLLVGCQKDDIKRSNTLSDFKINEEKIEKDKNIAVNKKDAEKAFKEYLRDTKNKSTNRKQALQRLAEIQIDMKISNPGSYSESSELESIALLKQRLIEFPDDKNNDLVLYQLANAYAISGKDSKKVEVLEDLVDKYPSSKYFVESMFRLGESYLSKSQFVDAELALTSVIIEDNKGKYKTNALFKRAWSKYKQLRYEEAILDYNELLAQFSSGKSANRSDQEFLNNVYRVYSACISYIGIDTAMASLKEWLPNDDIRYHLYDHLAKFMIEQDRYLDAASVYAGFLNTEQSPKRNQILVSLSSLWKAYPEKEYSIQMLEQIESKYGISAGKDINDDKAVATLAANLIYIAEYYHSLYQKSNAGKKLYASKSVAAYEKLSRFYNINDKDKYLFQYAELLQDLKQYKQSISTYHSAFKISRSDKQKQIITYALLTLSNKLYFNKRIDSHQYKSLNAKYMQYVSSKQLNGLLTSFAEFLYNDRNYTEAVSYIEENRERISGKYSDKTKYILASSYFEIGEYAASETTYNSINKKKNFRELNKRLALAVFRQAEGLKDKYLYDASVKKYDQISRMKLDNSIELQAQIDVSAIYMLLSNWDNAIKRLSAIQKKYPANKYSKDITQKLSVAYLNNNQDKLAALEFEKIYKFTNNDKLKRSALWQAAELYETGGDYWRSVKAYKTYIKIYKSPMSLYFEAMNKLIDLYSKLKQYNKREYWLRAIVKQINELHDKTDRMKYLASNSSIIIAREDYRKFDRVKLTVPLKISLTKKKKVLKSTVSSFQKVNQYKMFEHVSESIYWLAETYYNFSRSLLNSERPKNLSSLELEQYDILLEDQAIPFEDQAIRYYLQNTAATKAGKYGKWVAKSYDRLAKIYPSKFNRVEIVDSFVNQF